MSSKFIGKKLPFLSADEKPMDECSKIDTALQTAMWDLATPLVPEQRDMVFLHMSAMKKLVRALEINLQTEREVKEMVVATCNQETEKRRVAQLQRAEAWQLLQDERKDREDTEGMLRIALDEMRKRDKQLHKFIVNSYRPDLRDELEALNLVDLIKRMARDL